mmetsp:Transcript_15323/g.25490  ORF Transcript_15323/g.25490 Transcript_15323/m.25490 type:complete len:204 (+) Transcript_15323:175-786(+)|eukprot:CAMPEP_0114418848 /NCGR_PEP_ID=MMETSP0103-20121206/3715_1 /TAXON_ID=37642 ORGANISM="Paraphysomonas imperforata, Strain PA2" /NCGR_SAMPLE_ID=MMETSP0103 /ASSEMBLY_ACC=CAM_ASM_000201 /LENGTH=203 /DNA_ID=CAMNT_0001587233 /DNA_START=240 /DNA_END=851 /DNA_ORIENTATION=-
MTTISSAEDNTTPFDALYKVLLIGDEGSGTRAIFDTIDDDNQFIAEAGDDYKVKFFDILDLMIKFEIWNTYRYMKSRQIPSAYFTNARGAMLVYDPTSRREFINVRHWFSYVTHKGDQHIQVVLVAHTARNEEGKADEKRQSNDVVSADEGRALAEELGVPFCSVREGCTEDVQGAFLQLYCAMGSELEHSRAAEAYSYCTVM